MGVHTEYFCAEFPKHAAAGGGAALLLRQPIGSPYTRTNVMHETGRRDDIRLCGIGLS